MYVLMVFLLCLQCNTLYINYLSVKKIICLFPIALNWLFSLILLHKSTVFMGLSKQ